MSHFMQKLYYQDRSGIPQYTLDTKSVDQGSAKRIPLPKYPPQTQQKDRQT